MTPRICVTLLILCVILGGLSTNAQLNNIAILVYKGNNSALVKTAIFKNTTLITEISVDEEEDVPILKTGIFDGLYLLHTVKIQRTNLATLEENIFKGLRRIRHINLNFNRIQVVPANVFKNLPVYTVTLKGNGITKISEKAFFNLFNLHTLDLSSNNVELLPKDLFVRTTNLKFLNLSYNKLRHFPAVPYRPYAFFDVAFANTVPDDSSVLDLSYNNFTFISYYLLRGIRYINELRLNDNKVKSISEYAFDDFKKVNNLNLEGNDLEEIGDELLAVLTAVDDLRVENNPWKENFACKYEDWCLVNKKMNYMDVKCRTIKV